jgi:hypothetical protein
MFNLPAVCIDLGHTSNARAIRRLYFHGPYSPGSFDPYGRHILKRLREDAKSVVKAVKEFSQDITHGEVTNAIRGRHTSNLRTYESIVISARKGDRISQFLLPFHRRVLSISENDAREVHVRLINRETRLEDSEEVVRICFCTNAND